jgi:hypothetical protein
MTACPSYLLGHNDGKGDRYSVLDQLNGLYIPPDERTLRRVQQKGLALDRRVRVWAQAVIDLLPRGLSMLPDEVYILCLFLAQQRRLNLEMDARDPQVTLRTRLGRVLPFLPDIEEDPEALTAIHRIVATHLESEIDRACGYFCTNHNIPPVSDPSIDWRVSIRFMAQSVHNIMSQADLRKFDSSPRRFELAMVVRELSAAVIDRRKAMAAAFSPDPVRDR